MTDHVIRRGLDIPIKGEATGEVQPLDRPSRVVIDPREFRGVVPRLVARVGDHVAQGKPLFHAKSNAELLYLSPISGTVKEVQRGHRRVITGIVIEADAADDDPADLGQVSAEALEALSRDEIVARLLAGGAWWSLRQRPLDRVASPHETPQSILVCGTETGPLQPGPATLLSTDPTAFQLGLAAIRKLTDGTTHVSMSHGASHPAFENLSGVELHRFRGPHPSGDPSVQISHIDPPRNGRTVWYIHAWEVERIGQMLASGRYPATKVYAAVGAGVSKPRFVRATIGTPLDQVVGEVTADPARWIRGSVLTGTTAAADAGAGWFARAVHVLPEEVPRRLFGWMGPAFGQFSVHRAFPQAWFRPSGGRDLRPGIYGGHRGLVPIGQYRRVVATPDIEPEFLMKALSAGNLEDSLKLGLLDFSAEEAALCTYICPSKIEFDQLLRQGLDLYEREI